MNTSAGIHDLSIATTEYVLEHTRLAAHIGVDPRKFTHGIGQDAMSIPAEDEDIVTMAATAARPILERHGTDGIRTVLLATETGVDESKAAALYLHRLIGLPDNARVIELKQACYSATAALQFAAALTAGDPEHRTLVIAADIARYDTGSAAEATQGAAAAAMLVTADPAILRIEPVSGLYSAHVMDFWRPTYRRTAVVDGKYSVTAYLDAIEHAWNDYHKRAHRELPDFAAFCYHQPFTKMAYKAHRHLLERNGQTPAPEQIEHAIGATTRYNRLVGNSYTASLYLALTALFDHADDLTGKPIALVSYGSGCVAEFLSATVVPGYRRHLRTRANREALSRRTPITYEHYARLARTALPEDGSEYHTPHQTSGPYRFAGITGHIRCYEPRRANLRSAMDADTSAAAQGARP
ncbi:hydroxymethylglutaryl-CoA synthase [Nocardia tenerifensis]|uniref:Hydroxymethylglutaryl-CoA synthase n=1 Tax=Nocardia tenerifensis TaxID=228006 RepID=A0A318KKG2_9NOCA|nr:hydroxymethylglutaryl-CoA synthase [Nocardia tenerifensis]PXX61766.1 hydroxymethylglutaryl-CoA synthase [Nocardia tenerifensis]